MSPVRPERATPRAGPRPGPAAPTRPRPGGAGRPPETAARPSAARPAAGGRLGRDLLSIDLGPVPVPGIARRAISDTIDRELEKAHPTEGFALEAVQAREGAVTLVGRFR